MWEFPTSMLPKIRAVWALLLAVLCGLAGAVGGYLLHGATGGAANSQGSTITNQTLSITAAGTLGVVFPQAARALANLTPGIQVPLAAEHFQGSVAALSAVEQPGVYYDVASSADFRLVHAMLEPTYASWEVLYGTQPEVLAYDPRASALAGISATNWAWKITAPGILLGVANQSTDPNGYNGIFTLELQGLFANGSLSTVYQHFYSNPPGSYAQPNPSTTRVEPEANAATLLSTHVVQAFIIYRSYAIQHHLSYVDLDPHVNLGNLSTSMIQYYAQATTEVLNGGGPATSLVTGAPVAFSATVPLSATNATLGDLFVHFLVSPQGTALLSEDGFTPIVPAYADNPSALPPMLGPMVEPLPSTLQALLS